MSVKKASIKESIEDRYMVGFTHISYESPKKGANPLNRYRNYTIDSIPTKVDATTGDQNDILS